MMASTDQPAPESEKAAPPPETIARPPPRRDCFAVVDVVLRMLLFAAAVAAVVVMVTSKETKAVAFAVYMTANFKNSPAMIYFVAALSVAGFYALITTMVSFLALLKPRCSTKLLPHFVIFDVLMLGIVAAAAGTAGGVAYIGAKGDSRAGWTKVCNVFEKFCHHVEASVAVSIFASIVLALLVINSAHSLSKRIPKYFVAALSVAGFYALITTMVSFLALLKPRCSTKLLPHFVIFDVLMLGIVAEAAGTAGGVAYIGIKGDSRAGWTKVCNAFEKFCHHVEASVVVSIFASIVLALLVINSAHSPSKRIPK